MIQTLKEALSSNKIGNKTKNLSYINSLGFTVPNGIVLDIDEFQRILIFNHKEQEVKNIMSGITINSISNASEKLQNICLSLDIPLLIIKEIEGYLDVNKKYAIRSSSLQEDHVDLAYAGQYNSYLDVTIKDMKKYILECYASMYTKTALQYYFNNTLDIASLQMAILIQEMVDAEVSGVGFTVNPITGNDTEIVIEVKSGLGDSLMNGEVTPQSCTYNWYQQAFIKNSITLINHRKLQRLLDTLLTVQTKMGYPCDIEFAMINSTIYILQVRPITKITYQGVSTQWTNANFKDGGVSSSVCTPYMWSLYEYVWDTSLKAFLLAIKIVKEDELEKLSTMFFSRPYWNVNIVKLAMSRIPGYKEIDFDNELGITVTYQGSGKATSYSIPKILQLLPIGLAQKRIVKERVDTLESLKEKLLSRYHEYLDSRSIQYTYSQIKEKWLQLINHDYLESESTYFSQVFINTIEQTLCKNKLLKYMDENSYLILISGLNDISHTRPFTNILSICESIKEQDSSLQYWTNNTIDTIISDYIMEKDHYYLSLVRKHIVTFGYHSNKELDITYPCYYEDPTSVIEKIKRTLSMDIEPLQQGVSSLHQKQKEIYQSLKTTLSPNKYQKIKETITYLRKLLWWREEYKDISSRYYYIVRHYTLMLSKHLVSQKVFTSKEDIWYVKREDITQYLQSKISIDQLLALVNKNKKYYQSFRNYTSDNEIGMIYNAIPTIIDSELVGVGCNPGKVEGLVRVIDSIEDIKELQQGDILVTKFIDTGWTSSFGLLKGIISEHGGILCHAAIVAREYKIPCIVSAKNITKEISDGDYIRMDGGTGEIQILTKKQNRN